MFKGNRINTVTKYFPNWESSRYGVALGILNIHQYYDLDPADLVQGIVRDTFKRKVYQAKTRLGVGDAKLIAEIAQEEKVLYFLSTSRRI